MSDLFASGRIVDLILGFVLLELVLVGVLRSRRAGTASLADLLAALLPGVFLLLALRGALQDSAWTWVATCLTAALVTHLFDMSRRMLPRRRGG